ncbi:MAG: hypothetical protein RJQ21_04895 [Rhodospirillales bacterium]
MTELKFADISISVVDLPTRASALSDEAQGDVLGGFSWKKRRSMFARMAKRKIQARKVAKKSSDKGQKVSKNATAKASKARRSKRSSYLAKASFHGRMASKFKSLARKA